MNAALAFDLLLGLLLVGVALGAARVRDLQAVVMLFIVLGLFAALAWVRLGAIDVALAEAAIGAGLTGVLLVRAAHRVREPEPARETRGTRSRLRGLLLALPCGAVFLALAGVVLGPPPGPGLAAQVEARLGDTGLGNPVTAVLIHFRGYDTLLETVVLLAALIAVWSLCEDGAWGARAGRREHARAEGQMAFLARLLAPIGLVVGTHLFWAGATLPGGAFQAATVLAAVWLLLLLAGRGGVPAVTHGRMRAVVVAGPALFLAFGAAAIPFGGFLVFAPAAAKAATVAIEAGMTVSIAATLALLVIGPPEGPR